jgi:hypothetical protein
MMAVQAIPACVVAGATGAAGTAVLAFPMLAGRHGRYQDKPEQADEGALREGYRHPVKLVPCVRLAEELAQ